jgi:hypothetical protein
LTDALSNVTGVVCACNYSVPSPPAGSVLDPTNVNMIYSNGTGEYFLILPNDGGTCSKGWSYANATKSEIQICNVTCNLIQNNPSSSVSILFGCM